MQDLVGERRPNILVRDFVQRLAQERLDQKVARQGLGNAARTQVEKRPFVDLAGGRAVAAFNVVGVNLKLGLDVDLGPRRLQQRLAELITVRMLGILVDDDTALEHGP